GVIALNLREDDEVVAVKATAGTDELIMVSRKAMAIRFAETDVRPMGRTAGGVIAMKLDADDEVVAFDVVDQNGELLIVTAGGFEVRPPTADGGFRAWGTDLADLFETAARAMFSLEYDLDSVPQQESPSVAVRGDDLEGTLYAWLSELLWLHDAQGFFLSDA